MAPDVAAHVEGCDRCRTLRAGAAAETVHETYVVDGPSTGVARVWVAETVDGPVWHEEGVGAVIDVPASVRRRFEALAAVAPAGVAQWTGFAPEGERARVTGTPLCEASAMGRHPLAGARALVDAVAAIAALQQAGLGHGGLAAPLVRFTDAGRLCLPWPALTVAVDPREDWAALAELAASWTEGAEGVLDAMRTTGSAERVLAECVAFQAQLVWGPGRYSDFRKLGEGGMGVVWQADDRVLGRRVALKRIKPNVRDPDRFLSEAQLTAQLTHPGIVPVHELGEDVDGRPFYTMEVVDGLTLAEVIGRLHDRTSSGGWPDASDDDEWTLPRVIDALARVCDAVGYAHDRGVVHRDIKPSNVMLGRHGEVRVMDWGIATVLGTSEDAPHTVRTEGEGTRLGVVAGSPTYLAPEVGPAFAGDRRRDVYALGITLREVLQGHPGPERLVGTPPAPAPLDALVQACTADDPEDRPPDAGAVARGLRRWLEGLARRRLAAASVESAEPLRATAEAARTRAAALRAEADAAWAGIDGWAPLERKRPVWALEDEARALEVEAEVQETRYEQGLRAALDHDPENRVASERIGALYRSQLEEAERAGQRRPVARLTTLLETHDGGRHRAWLREGGRVTLITEPPGAEVELAEWVEVDRHWVARPVRALGVTPLTEVPVDRGSWQLRIRHPACEEVVYPVFLERGALWDGTPPEASGPAPIGLPAAGTVGPDACVVPAGWFVAGGDADALDALRRRRLWVDGFVMQRDPVTVQSYLGFLDALIEAGRDPEPYVPAVTSEAGTQPLFAHGPAGWEPTAAATGPRQLAPGGPVTSVTWHAAQAYAAWRAEAEGVPWRLPHDLEWEKAARGVDARPFPWGDAADGALACFGASHAGQPTIQDVDAFEHDVSPYGIRGLGGNVRDWCLNGYAREGPVSDRVQITPPEGPYRMCRGGAFTSSESLVRSATRMVERPGQRMLVVGFRLVRSVP